MAQKTVIGLELACDIQVFCDIYRDGKEPFYKTWAVTLEHKRALERLAKRGLIVKGHDAKGLVIFYYDEALVEQSVALDFYKSKVRKLPIRL